MSEESKAQKKAQKKARKKARKKEVEQAKKEKINGNKSAQMIFKTALRNHIDLTSIADNKANLMITINALIITVMMPLLAKNIGDHAHLLFPMGVLFFCCIVSMVYATLATLPIKTKGETSLEEIRGSTRSNLFFYGNFYKMDIKNYKEGLKIVMKSDEKLDNSVMNDLFYLGEALGKKFDLLRVCYFVFLGGVIISVLLFFLLFH